MKKRFETEVVDLKRRGFFLGKLSVSESKGELILVQEASSKIIDPLREEIGAQGKSLITANPDELKEMQTLDAEIASYRAEVLQRGVSKLELDTLLQRVVNNILGTKLERRSVLQGMKHLLLHRGLVRDILRELMKKPFVLMPKSVIGILEAADVLVRRDSEEVHPSIASTTYSILCKNGYRIIITYPHTCGPTTVTIESPNTNISNIIDVLGNPQAYPQDDSGEPFGVYPDYFHIFHIASQTSALIEVFERKQIQQEVIEEFQFQKRWNKQLTEIKTQADTVLKIFE